MITPEDIKDAREILGEDAAGKTDEQIAEIIAGLDAIADMVIDCYITQRRNAAKNPHEKKNCIKLHRAYYSNLLVI